MGSSAEHAPVGAAGRVADQLRDLIRDGAYAPGARLVERAIARELGTSHIPVREALARLAEEGLVVRLPRRGARVAELSPRLLEEISSVRVVLEQFVCRRVLERWTTSAQAELAGLARRMTVAAERGSTKTIAELDVRFHETLWQLADHELLLEVAAACAAASSASCARPTPRSRPRSCASTPPRTSSSSSCWPPATRTRWRRPCAGTSRSAPSASRAPGGITS